MTKKTITTAQYATSALETRLRELPRYSRWLQKSYAGRMRGLSLIQVTSHLNNGDWVRGIVANYVDALPIVMTAYDVLQHAAHDPYRVLDGSRLGYAHAAHVGDVSIYIEHLDTSDELACEYDMPI